MKEDIALSQQRHLLLSEELWQMRWWEHISFPRSQLAIMCLGVASAQQLSPFRASHTLRKSNDSQHPTPGSHLPLEVVTAPGSSVGCLVKAEGTTIFAAVLKHNLVSCKVAKLLNRVQSVSIGLLMF